VLYEADDNPLDGDAAFRLEIVRGSIAHEKAQGGGGGGGGGGAENTVFF